MYFCVDTNVCLWSYLHVYCQLVSYTETIETTLEDKWNFISPRNYLFLVIIKHSSTM